VLCTKYFFTISSYKLLLRCKNLSFLVQITLYLKCTMMRSDKKNDHSWLLWPPENGSGCKHRIAPQCNIRPIFPFSCSLRNSLPLCLQMICGLYQASTYLSTLALFLSPVALWTLRATDCVCKARDGLGLDRSVGIAIYYGLDGPGINPVVARFPASVQTDPDDRLTYCKRGCW